MQIPGLPFDLPVTALVFLAVFAWLMVQRPGRAARDGDDAGTSPAKRRGPDMAYSAGRDPAHQNTRLRQIFIPADPGQETAMRAFYLGELGLQEMRSPHFPPEPDGFWAVSGTRQIYVGSHPRFVADKDGIPSFPVPRLADVAERLQAAGHVLRWDRSSPYVALLIVTDPGGTQIALIPA